VEQLLALDGNARSANRLEELVPLETLEPGVEHLEPGALDCLIRAAGRENSFDELRDCSGELPADEHAWCAVKRLISAASISTAWVALSSASSSIPSCTARLGKAPPDIP